MMIEETVNARNFHRSAQAPVTMVSAVSMNTISNRKITITPTSYVCPTRNIPDCPHKPHIFPKIEIACSEARGCRPPRLELPAAPPICMAKPMIQ